MNIKINKDPDVEYKNEFMLGYTLKEVICIVVALGVVVLATVIAYMAAGISPMIGCYIGIPFAFPIIFFGIEIVNVYREGITKISPFSNSH